MILSEQKQQRRNRLSIIKMMDTEGDEMALSEHIEEFSQRIVFVY